MRTHKLWFTAAALVIVACGPVDKAREKAHLDDPPEPKDVEDAVVEKLHCSGIARDETRDLVADAVEGRDLKNLAARPADLARIVAGAAVTTDTSALLWGNVGAVTSQKQMRSAVAGRWSDLECAEKTSKTCRDALSGRSGGTVQTSVRCDDSRPTSVRSSFQSGCRLFATENSGAVELDRDSSLAFDGLVFGSVREVDGGLDVRTQSGDLRRFSIETGGKLSVSSDPGKSCRKTTTLRELTATDRDSEANLTFDASRTSDEKTVRVKTLDAPVAYDKPVDCSCPTDGALRVRHSDPVGLGEPGTIRLEYASREGASCSTATAEIRSWPEGCGESGESDECGREVVEDLVSELVTASCTGWSASGGG